MARKVSESFVENGGGKFAYDHVVWRRRGGWNCVCPRERAVRVDIGVGREGDDFYFSTIAMTSAGLLVLSPVSGSRSAVSCWVLGPCVLEVRSEAVRGLI